jgi:hypothetical protein
MASKVQKRIRVTGIVIGVIALSTFPLYMIFRDAWHVIPGLIMLVGMTSIYFLPVAIVLGIIDLVMAISSRLQIKVKKTPVQETEARSGMCACRSHSCCLEQQPSQLEHNASR